jgi:hypothetical protein
LDPVVELNEADGIVRKILSRQSVSEDEFRYAVMFNLTAMTQLLWELSNSQNNTHGKKSGVAQTEPHSQSDLGGLKNRLARLAPIAAIAAFLAGMGIGYLLP